MAEINDIVRDAVKWFYGSDGFGFGIQLYPAFDEQAQTYAVLAAEKPTYKEGVGVVVFARIDGDFVVIEEDNTDKPLLNRLLERGVPREKIILAYDNEKVPEPAAD